MYRQGEMQWLATFHNKEAKTAKELFVVVTTGGRVPSSWRDADPTKIEKRPDGSHWQWVVTFDDQAQPQHKQVFIFLLPYGEFVATNFSGK